MEGYGDRLARGASSAAFGMSNGKITQEGEEVKFYLLSGVSAFDGSPKIRFKSWVRCFFFRSFEESGLSLLGDFAEVCKNFVWSASKLGNDFSGEAIDFGVIEDDIGISFSFFQRIP